MNQKIKTSEEKAHATFGASGSSRWIACTASIKESEGCENPTSAAAEEGTEAHACFEFLTKVFLKSGFNPTAKNTATRKWGPEAVEHALNTIEYLVENGYIFQGCKDIYIEQRLDSSAFTRPGEFGTADLLKVDFENRVLVMGDYKYGVGHVVEPKDNTQLMYYALAALLRFGHKKFTFVRLLVLQPRAPHDDGPFRYHDITVSELLAWGKVPRAAVKEALGPNPKYNPSPSTCHWCLAAFKCKAFKEYTMKNAMSAYDDDAGTYNTPDVRTLTPDQIGRALLAADAFEIYIESLRKHAFQLAQKGVKIPGHKLVKKKATRTWADEQKVKRILVKHFGNKVLSEQKLLSPAQVEKLVTTKQMKKFIKEHTTNEAVGVTFVADSDRRKAVANRSVSYYDED